MKEDNQFQNLKGYTLDALQTYNSSAASAVWRLMETTSNTYLILHFPGKCEFYFNAFQSYLVIKNALAHFLCYSA